MKEIRAGDTKEMGKHIVDCAIKSTVYAGKDSNGPFLMVINLDGLRLTADEIKNKNMKPVVFEKGSGIKVYDNKSGKMAGKIAPGTPTKDMTVIKQENYEISEHIKLPEKENTNITKESLIKEINNMIRTCQSYVEQMDIAVQKKNIPDFNKAKQNLEVGVRQIDSKMTQLAAITANKDPHTAISSIVEISNAVSELHRATERNIFAEMKPDKDKQVRENPYALHLKAMMDIKENLGQDEIRGTISNVNGVVQKEGFGDVTKASMNAAHKHINEAGATAIRDDISGLTPDTTYEDVDDLLENGETGINMRYALNVANEIEQEDKVRTLFDE